LQVMMGLEDKRDRKEACSKSGTPYLFRV